MKTTAKLLAASVMAISLLGGTNAWAASISSDGLRNNNDQIMTDVSTYAGLGDSGGSNQDRLLSTFRNPIGIAVLDNGTLLVSDARNHLIRNISSTKVNTAAGVILKKDDKGFPLGGWLDGKNDKSLFQEPAGLTVDKAGNIYVADAGNNAIRKVDTLGNVTTLAGNGLIGNHDGSGTDATLYHPQDVAVAADGTIYVADTLNHVIRSISPNGKTTTLTAASKRTVEVTPGQVVWSGDYVDGEISKSKFNEPSGLAIDPKGNLYISDSGNQRIRYMDFSTGKVRTVAGNGKTEEGTAYASKELYAPGDFADGDALKALFNFPAGIALTPEGGLVIADSMNQSIRYLMNGKVITLAGVSSLKSGETDGVERAAQFQRPTDVAVSADGTIFIADAFNNKVRRLDVYQLPLNLPKDNNIKVVLGSKMIEFDAQPEIVNGRTMVPVRAITEALGYKVDYKDADRSVQLTKGDVTIELYIDKTGMKKIEKNKQDITKATDTSPYVLEDRTYVPIRFFAEEIGLDVQWNDASKTAILRPMINTAH